ncbi:MAG: glycosyltransferase [Desulfurobacteriaceae bacterium]
MEEKVSVLVISTGKFNEELVTSLEENRDYIKEVFISGDTSSLPEGIKDLQIPLIYLDIQTFNKAVIRNKFLESSSSELVLFLSSECSLEDSTIEELVADMEDFGADIVYPNLIVQLGEEEKIRNFDDFYGKEVEIVKSLSIEKLIPEWGILARKSKIESLNRFDEKFADYEFYEFLYRNLRNLRLKLSELSYVTYSIGNTFIDTSYRSLVIRNNVLKNYDWKSEIFPFLSWEEKPEVAEATALTIVGRTLSDYYDYFNASDFFRKALLTFHNQVTLQELIKIYLNMGLFREAKDLISDLQGVSKEDQEKLNFYTEKVESLVKELEKGVEEGKVFEVFTAIQDVATFYEGAPIHNILGVINWIQGNKEEAYKFFFKAVTMNPLDNDYLYNLAEVAKDLNRKEEVKNLIERLVSIERKNG